MDYNLAKQLKDAGFPQTNSLFYWSTHTTPPTWWAVSALDQQAGTTQDSYIAAPTLEELIEACGSEFSDLYRNENSQVKWGTRRKHELGASIYFGSTPTEAVANLYLALHKK